jgi:hypothetical protein
MERPEFAIVAKAQQMEGDVCRRAWRAASWRGALPLLPLGHSMPPLAGNVHHERMVQFSRDKVRRIERGVESTKTAVSSFKGFYRF